MNDSSVSQQHPAAHHLPGMAYAVLGYGVMTAFDTLLKLASHGGYSQAQMMVVAALTGTMTLIVLALLTGGLRCRLGTRRWRFHLLRSLLSLGAFCFGFYALRHIHLVDFYGIIFAIPLFITLLSVAWLREHVGWPRWAALAMGFVGVTIMLRMGVVQAPSAGAQAGYFAALAAALFAATSTVMVRRYGRGESNLTFSFYSSLCSLAAAGGMLLWQGGMAFALRDVVILGLAGILSAIGGVLLMTAYQISPPPAVAPFQYTQMIWGALLGYVLFHEVPGVWSLTGAGIIIASGMLVLWREAALARKLKRAARNAMIDPVSI